MMPVENLVERVPEGFRVDGLELLEGRCHGPHGSGSRHGDDNFRRTYSIVKQEGNVVAFFAKATTSISRDNYEWGYRVKKGPVEVNVLVYDTRDRQTGQFAGHYPPPVSAWQERGWDILEQFDRPLEAPGKNRLG